MVKTNFVGNEVLRTIRPGPDYSKFCAQSNSKKHHHLTPHMSMQTKETPSQQNLNHNRVRRPRPLTKNAASTYS